MVNTLTLDVSPAAPADLRRRLAAASAATLLPGGLQLEESLAGATYSLNAEGGWTSIQLGGEWHFTHADGHVVVLNERGLTVTTG